MESIDVIQLLGYISALACFAVAGYFLHDAVKKRRAPLWWAAGFSLSACGSLAMMAVRYGLDRSYASGAFALFAAAMAVFYYAASLLFFNRDSFFREKFTVVLFLVSIVLLMLPMYVLPEEHTLNVMKSPAVSLFTVAFLVLAVVFHRVAVLCGRIAVGPYKAYICRWLGALLFLVWILAVWCLYIALFWGSIIAIGLVFALSSFGFVLLWYRCKGGEKVIEEKKNGELNIQRIDGMEYKIKIWIGSVRERLNDAMQKAGDALIHTMAAKDEKGGYVLREGFRNGDQVETSASRELRRKNKMVTYASTIGMKKDELMVHIVELSGNILGLARSFFESSSFHQYGEAGSSRSDKADFSKTDGNGSLIPEGNHHLPPLTAVVDLTEEVVMTDGPSGKIKSLATMAFFKSSTDRDMIEACCDLVKAVCDLENKVVTKKKWKKLQDYEHPGGVIGHTYHILLDYGKYAEDFRKEFQERADDLYNGADRLREIADNLMKTLRENKEQAASEQAQDITQAEAAIERLNGAVALIQNASLLIGDASEFVGNLLNPSTL